MSVPVTSLFAGLLILLYLYLGFGVVGQRRKTQTGLGTGGHDSLEQAVRAHGNFNEYVPLALLVLLLLELNQLPSWALYAYGAALVIGRVLHAMGLKQSGGRSFGRFYGTLVTWSLLLIGAITLIIRHFL